VRSSQYPIAQTKKLAKSSRERKRFCYYLRAISENCEVLQSSNFSNSVLL